MIDRSRCLQDVPQEGPYSSARSAIDPGAFGEGQILVSKRSTRGGSSHERSLRHQTARAAKKRKSQARESWTSSLIFARGS